MLTGKKIALCGIHGFGKYVYAGLAALTYSETKNEESDFNFDILKILEPADYTTLVKAYKNVQKKYYPENDVLVKRKNKNII